LLGSNMSVNIKVTGGLKRPSQMTADERVTGSQDAGEKLLHPSAAVRRRRRGNPEARFTATLRSALTSTKSGGGITKTQ